MKNTVWVIIEYIQGFPEISGRVIGVFDDYNLALSTVKDRNAHYTGKRGEESYAMTSYELNVTVMEEGLAEM